MKLTSIVKRIISSEYESIEDLIRYSERFDDETIQKSLKQLMIEWKKNGLTVASLHVVLKFFRSYLEKTRTERQFQNMVPLPICYFSPFLLMGATYIYSYLLTSSIDVKLFQLDEKARELKEYVQTSRPPALIFTLAQFLHVDFLKDLCPFLHEHDLSVFVGGIPFKYDKELKDEFGACIFPRDVNELVFFLKHSWQEDNF